MVVGKIAATATAGLVLISSVTALPRKSCGRNADPVDYSFAISADSSIKISDDVFSRTARQGIIEEIDNALDDNQSAENCKSLGDFGEKYDTSDCGEGDVNDLCDVKCAEGFQGGFTEYQCGVNTDKTLSWKGQPPNCRGDETNRCIPLVLPDIYRGLDYKCQRVTPGTACQVVCRNTAVEGNGGQRAQVCREDEDGVLGWQGGYPNCTGTIASCAAIDYYGDGYISECGAGLEGDTCRIFCSVTRVGSAQDFTCGADGQWQGTKPTCNSKPDYEPLKDVFNDFLIGASIRDPVEELEAGSKPETLVSENYNVLIPENYLAWKYISSREGEYDFEKADLLVEYAEEKGLPVIGHSLAWKGGGWISEPVDGEDLYDTLMRRMERHITDVVGRYKGRIGSWVVVNEWFDNDGNIRQDFALPRTLGKEGIKAAFRFAHNADPEAKLYYNGHHLWKKDKADGLVEFYKEMVAEGVPINGIGMQGHQYHTEGPTYNEFVGTYVTATIDEFDYSVKLFGEAGAEVLMTEVDVSVNPEGWSCCRALELESLPEDFQDGVDPYPNGLPETEQVRLAAHYRKFFQMIMRNKQYFAAVYFWGLSDDHTWYNFWPINGRKDYPLLFNEDYQPKLAYYSVLDMVQRGDY
ncbi:hypothetical protein SARC_02199 [Sphaeroforma arctica JP610]|uniref:GH10 domain-containing protein n=1 Tax=Sphaeroforma arctica JP610 TaxID=667725 RepID=A0A0L0G9S9_9EUKA|nr:hypothetical protein SARC_02199 [Sphaeroforma arctica JP610]KNC85626.1 hypothetical protein SARC_02199 [Sphaeroforma arctica JP610]|eukprot:XP_014159528.1 hypothetical protein SARC_02199 [Sphaeroforma arctica JP610]